MISSLSIILSTLLCQMSYGFPSSQHFNFLRSSTSMNSVEDMEVKCGKTGMKVTLTFDHKFEGAVYSKGHYYDPDCNYQNEEIYDNVFRFWIPADGCGTEGNMAYATSEQDMYFKNTIVIQNDPIIQEMWDTAKTLRCSWTQTMKKSIQSDPITVQGPQQVHIKFDSKALNTLTYIESGARRSSSASSVSGYVSSTPDDRSLVIYLKDSAEIRDANVVSCYWRSGSGREVPLIDAHGCLARSDLISEFEKIHKPANVDADFQLFASLRGLQLEDDPNFSISCDMELCENRCLPSCALGPVQHHVKKSKKTRNRRQAPSSGVSSSSVSNVPEGIIIFPSQTRRDSSTCYIGDLVAITTSSLFALVCILGGICVYLVLRLKALTPHKTRVET